MRIRAVFPRLLIVTGAPHETKCHPEAVQRKGERSAISSAATSASGASNEGAKKILSTNTFFDGGEEL